MFIESLVALVIFANVSVPVVPDPDYLQQLYPSSIQQPNNNFLQSAPVTQQELNQATSGATQPTDIMSVVSLAVTAGLGYMFQRQKTVTDRRTYMAADTSLKLAQNDQSSDAKNLKTTYALSCLADIVGKFHKDEMETYQTVDGVSLWTYIENLNISNNEDFQAKYVNKPPVQPTGSQSKDKVVATFNQVQQSITPTPSVEAPNTTKQNTFASGTASIQSGGSSRVQSNRIASEASAAEETGPATVTG
jgi:hypothetical protein